MIAHHIGRKGGTYARLGCYILGIKDPSNHKVFERLSVYVVDRVGGGERVVAARVTNCADDDIEMAIADIEMVQVQNTRSQSGKSYHLVISFPHGERPTLEQLRDIEDHLVAAIGFSEHQRISAVHDDTDNLHVHVAINKVHPTTFRNVDPHRDYPKLMAACRELEIRHGLSLDNHGLAEDQIRNLARDPESASRSERLRKMEAYSGCPSLAGWIEQNAKEEILGVTAQAISWEAVHEVFARCGLELHRKGAGLSVRALGRKVGVKASSIDRALSVKALTDRLGPYQSPAQAHGPPLRRYGEAGDRNPQNRRLYVAYNVERSIAAAARAAALAHVEQSYGDYAVELGDYYRREKVRVRMQAGLSGRLRQQAMQAVEARRKAAYKERDASRTQARAETRTANPLPTWQKFLEREASRGDEAALSALRSRSARKRGVRGDIITALDQASARDVVYQQPAPEVQRNGEVVYRASDGGRVTDRGVEIRADTMSEEAAFLALALASDRFEGQALIVEGSDAFRAAVLDAATLGLLKVAFADPALEGARFRLSLESDARRQGATPAFRHMHPQSTKRSDGLTQEASERVIRHGRGEPELGR